MIDKDLDGQIRKAIENKWLMKFAYKGQERIVEPHDYGVQKQTPRLFCYQVGGKSQSRIPGWRLMDVSGMQDCSLLEQHFAGNREAPSGRHHQWDEIFARVARPNNS